MTIPLMALDEYIEDYAERGLIDKSLARDLITSDPQSWAVPEKAFEIDAMATAENLLQNGLKNGTLNPDIFQEPDMTDRFALNIILDTASVWDSLSKYYTKQHPCATSIRLDFAIRQSTPEIIELKNRIAKYAAKRFRILYQSK